MARVEIGLNSEIYAKLIARYNDIVKRVEKDKNNKEIYEIDIHLSEGVSIIIDVNYINTHFKKLFKALDGGDTKIIESIKNDIHSSFGILSEDDQEFARKILADIESGKLKNGESSFTELLDSYKNKDRDEHIKTVCENLGIDENSVKRLINERRDENNLNQNNDFENIMDKMDLDKEFIINMNDYFRFIKNHNDRIKDRLTKRLKKADLTLDEFILWMETDNR